MRPPGAAHWHPERSCSIATALSASTRVTALDKVDRLEARTAFRAPEPDAQPGAPQAAVAAEPGARQAVVVAPDVQREAAVADAAVAAEPDAQQAAAVEPDARQAVAVEPDVQQAAAVALDAQQGAESDAQQGAEEAAVSDAQLGAAVAAASDVQQAAVSAPMVGSVKLRVRRLAASVEPAETAAVRLWFRATMVSAAALEPALVSAVKVQAAADRWPVACRLLRAAAVRQPPATLARLSFRALLASALGQEPSAKEKAAADRRSVVCRVPVACQRAASNREPECLRVSYSEPVPPLARLTAAAKARARQPRPLRQCRQQQRRPPAMILRRQAEAALLEAVVRQLEAAVGTQAIEPAARSSASARPDWSP